MGSYIAALVFVVSLLFWVGLFLAVRFDRNANDVSEIEISVFPSPDPEARPERSISIKDSATLSRLFDGLTALQPYKPIGHEHAVGKSYGLRLRRRSDGQWSGYRVQLHPDKEPTGGGVRNRGVYQVTLEVGPVSFNTGRYQAPGFGMLVEEIARGSSPLITTSTTTRPSD
jgi:hypothetical protein